VLSEEFPTPLTGLRPGSLVAGYRLEVQAGAGGMAVVFRARDERLGRLVALKILAPALAADAAFRRRFIAESRAAAAVDDPHIIPIYEAGEADGALFIAMRFVRGGDLRTVLYADGALAPARAAAFISPVASALDAAHGAGLVHRDVKPANILVDARPGRPDHVYLSDFGVSKGAMSSVSLTAPGQFLGTPDYSAPEQIQGLGVDGRTDQYALACVAYQLLTGAAPFERDQGMAVLFAHLSEPPPSLASRRPDLPRAADLVLAKGLAKDPEKRYASCRDFADALQEALTPDLGHPSRQVSVPAHPPAKPAPPRPESTGPATPAMPATPATGATEGTEETGYTNGTGHAAVTPDPAATIDSLFVGGSPGAGEVEVPAVAVSPAATAAESPGLPGEPGQPAADAGGPSGTNVLVADPAPAIRSHRAQPAQRPRAAQNPRTARRRRYPIATASLLVLLAAILVGGFVAWRFTQDQYYVGADSKGEVVIYRGINQQVVGISLSSPYETTGIMLAQVPSPYQQTVKATDAVSSLNEARIVVGNLRTAVNACQQQYQALASWVAKENAYLVAEKQKKSGSNPGPQPLDAAATCPPPQAYGIAPSALTSSNAG
jgi:serine/threonine protein kinase